MTIKKHDIIC